MSTSKRALTPYLLSNPSNINEMLIIYSKAKLKCAFAH